MIDQSCNNLWGNAAQLLLLTDTLDTLNLASKKFIRLIGYFYFSYVGFAIKEWNPWWN